MSVIIYDIVKLVVAMMAGVGLTTLLFLLGFINVVQIQLPY